MAAHLEHFIKKINLQTQNITLVALRIDFLLVVKVFSFFII